jgi:hypothetical protein
MKIVMSEETKTKLANAMIEQIIMEVWREPAPRDPAFCIGGIPLPKFVPMAGAPEVDEAVILVKYAKIKDLAACLEAKEGQAGRAADMTRLDEALAEALRRAHGDRGVDISEIIDR